MNGFVKASLFLLFGASSAFCGEIETALDCPNLTFTTGGDAPWFVQNAVCADTPAAMQTGKISGNQQTWIKTEVDRPGKMIFSWKSSCEKNWDVLYFQQGDAELAKISGNSAN